MSKIKQVYTVGAHDHVAASLENHHIVSYVTYLKVSTYVVCPSLYYRVLDAY